MSADNRVRVQDSLKLIMGYCQDIAMMRRGIKSKKQFLEDKVAQYAFCTPLEQIGEQAKRIDKWLETHYDYDWSKVMKFRDFIAHQYGSIDFEIVWDVIEKDVPELYGILLDLYEDAEDLPDSDFDEISSRKEVRKEKPKRRTFWDLFQRNKY